MDGVVLKVLGYFKKYTSVGVLRALEDLYVLYGIEPEVGMRAINELIKMGVLEREGDIFSGVLNYVMVHGRKTKESGFVSEFEVDVVKRVVDSQSRLIKWREDNGK